MLIRERRRVLVPADRQECLPAQFEKFEKLGCPRLGRIRGGKVAMNPQELLRIVDAIHRDKNIDKEIVFEGIEQAILSAAKKHFGEEEELEILIDRVSGNPTLKHVGQPVDSDHLGEILGRISAQTAKQVMIQKMREAERDSVFDDYAQMRGQIVSGTVGRAEGGATVVTLGKIEGILPRSEQI